MKKKLFCCMIAFMLLVAGCAELPTASYADGSPESSEAGTSSAAATEASESSAEEPAEQKEFDPNALRICFVVGDELAENDRDITALETLLASGIQTAGGPENIEFDSIPYEGSAREIAMDRIRTEIMAGGGPDVFIVTTQGSNSLFPIPEKAMQEGVFLPLDTYIQNMAQSEWDKLTPAVLEAGRTDEGQVLVPMMYTLPITIYKKEDVPEAPPAGTTWQEMLSDETNILRNAAVMTNDVSGGLLPDTGESMLSVLGRFTDYETNELLFSEEDLLQCAEAMLTLKDEIDRDDTLPVYAQGMLCGNGRLTFDEQSSEKYPICKNDAMTMIPLYSKDGDVTATVRAYTGINRNTKHAEEAFFVVDYLMRVDVQQNLKMFYMLGQNYGLPIHEDVLSPEFPQQKNGFFFTDENFETLSGVRDQITNVYFDNALVQSLSGLYSTLYYDYTYEGKELPEQALKDAVHETYGALKQMLSE